MYKKLIALLMCALLCAGLCFMGNAAEDIIKINDADGLSAIAENPNADYILMSDIDMTDINWQPTEFYGIFDGNGHTVYNLDINQTGQKTAITIDGNRKEYDTTFAALFSVTENAVIKNLNLLNVDVNITDEDCCFAAGLAGYVKNTQIENCSVTGRVYLETKGKMCGVAGVAGFGSGRISKCNADVTAVFADKNKKILCEQFMGGILACGYAGIDGCTVKLDGYASVYGYVHNGGIVGMYHKDKNAAKHDKFYVNNCSSDTRISFFECTASRRAYCEAIIGEPLCVGLTCRDNKIISFKKQESDNYDTILLPEMCSSPHYQSEETAPTCNQYGFTTYTCKGCGYCYTDNYVHPAHIPGEWQTERKAQDENAGLRVRRCTVCGEIAEEQEFTDAGDILLDGKSLDLLLMDYKESYRLDTNLAQDGAVVWSSSDDSVVTVDKSGNITATGCGNAEVSCVSLETGRTARCSISVDFAWWQWIILIVLFGWIWY